MTERGEYSQYNEQETIENIRRYRLQRYSDTQIWRDLLKMPRRTFYYFVNKMHEHDAAIYDEERARYKQQLREDVANAKERLLIKLQELQKIIDAQTTSTKERIEAIKEARETEIEIVTLGYEKPAILGEDKHDSGQAQSSKAEQEQEPEQQAE